MNKLHASLLIAKSAGWRDDLSLESQKAFDFLLERAAKITDDDLTPEDLNVIRLIDSFLLDKKKDNKCLN